MATRKEVQQQKEAAMQTRKEVWGVVMIALAIFLAVCQYVEALGIVGEAVTNVLAGLFGLFAYALPPVLAAGGIFLIANAIKTPRKGRVVLVVIGTVFVVTLLHVIARPVVENIKLFDYVKDAYALGTVDVRGGGAVGATVSFCLLQLLGEIGAYIFTITGILIVILLVTRISLRETGRQVKTRVQEGIQYASEKSAARKQELYTQMLEEDEPVSGWKSTKKRRPEEKPTRRVPQEAAPFPTEGMVKRSRQSRMRGELDEDISFLPTEGLIEKKKPDADDIPPFTMADLDDDTPNVTYYEETYHAAEPDDIVTVRASSPKRVKKAEQIAVEDLLETAGESERPPYVPPSTSLLNPPKVSLGRAGENPAEQGRILVETLESFHVQARIVNISVGPVITRYELAPAPGVRVNRITALSDDIALALAAPRVRIEAPIPGKAAVGIEVPNKDTATVVLRDIIESREFKQAKSPISLALGKDIAGKVIVADLAKMPHLLIAGATGSGKSVCINGIVMSLVFRCTPDELQMILVDPKVVELSAFNALPHLRVPVVTDPKKAAGALANGVKEMTDRYQKFAAAGARDLERYNELQTDPKEKLPKLVIIIDELADLMMVAPDTVEDSICRIAQLGRACGIHLVVATQRPSADVITGLIKANIPSRIAFAVASAIDSRIILDSGGAEKLLSRGDMLFHPNGSGKPQRAQGAFVSDEEVERLVQHFQQQSLTPEYDEQLIAEMEAGARDDIPTQGNGKQEDVLLGEAVRIVLDSGQASISMIQRRLRVGYARAARLVDMMEQQGFVSGFDGSKPRKVLITRLQYEQLFGGANDMRDDDGEEMDAFE